MTLDFSIESIERTKGNLYMVSQAASSIVGYLKSGLSDWQNHYRVEKSANIPWQPNEYGVGFLSNCRYVFEYTKKCIEDSHQIDCLCVTNSDAMNLIKDLLQILTPLLGKCHVSKNGQEQVFLRWPVDFYEFSSLEQAIASLVSNHGDYFAWVAESRRKGLLQGFSVEGSLSSIASKCQDFKDYVGKYLKQGFECLSQIESDLGLTGSQHDESVLGEE